VVEGDGGVVDSGFELPALTAGGLGGGGPGSDSLSLVGDSLLRLGNGEG
jgi:hypothetical protein